MSSPDSASCLISEFANILQVNQSIFLIVNDVNQTEAGVQNFDILILENSKNSSDSLANALIDFLKNNTLSCKNATTLTSTNETIVSPSSFTYQMRLISNTFDSSNYQLIIQVNLRTSVPLSSDTSSFNLNTTIPYSSTYGSLTCGTDFCDQTITVTYNLNGIDCSGVNEYQIMQLDVAFSGSDLCSYYLSAINGKKIEIPFTISAEWCPKEEITTIDVGHFLLSSNGSQINNGDSLTTSRIIDAEILVNILTKVTGTSLSSSTISNLILSDGTTAHLIASNKYTYTTANTENNVTFEFTHEIDPAQIALNFFNPLTYITTVQVSFLPSTQKKAVDRAVRTETISPKIQSSRFNFANNNNGAINNGRNNNGGNNSGGSKSTPPPSSAPSNRKLFLL